MREKGQTEAAKTLETPVFLRGIEILTEKIKFAVLISPAPTGLFLSSVKKICFKTFRACFLTVDV